MLWSTNEAFRSSWRVYGLCTGIGDVLDKAMITRALPGQDREA